MPHEYPRSKVVTLAPLAARAPEAGVGRSGRALVIGQPLTGTGLMDSAGMSAATGRIRSWLAERGIRHVVYRGHPKDPNAELSQPGDELLQLDEPMEQWLPGQRFDAVVGVRSTLLLFARQVFGPETAVCAFGWDHLRFKSASERRSMERAFQTIGVELKGA